VEAFETSARPVAGSRRLRLALDRHDACSVAGTRLEQMRRGTDTTKQYPVRHDTIQ
jgi:hypothetical protein